MKIRNTSVWGFEHAFRGMRNPMNSWHLSDSSDCYETDCNDCRFNNDLETWLCNGSLCEKYTKVNFLLGEKDLQLAQTLIKGGGEHRKFLRMIHVSCDIDMPRYFWSEADTYGFKVQNSCSTMHRLLNNANPISTDLFVVCEEDLDLLNLIVDKLESLRIEYKEIQATTKDTAKMNRLLLRAKRILPEGFLQLRTWDGNYELIRNMYWQRKNHRLKEEWVDTFCSWVEQLPYATELILYK